MDAFTTYFESRYFWMVFTFVGDSTTTKDRFTPDLSLFNVPSPSPAGRAPAPRPSVGREAGEPTLRSRAPPALPLLEMHRPPRAQSARRAGAPRPSPAAPARDLQGFGPKAEAMLGIASRGLALRDASARAILA